MISSFFPSPRLLGEISRAAAERRPASTIARVADSSAAAAHGTDVESVSQQSRPAILLFQLFFLVSGSWLLLDGPNASTNTLNGHLLFAGGDAFEQRVLPSK